MPPRPRTFLSAAVFLLLLPLLCSSCGTHQAGPSKTTRYTLEYDPPVLSGLPPLDTTLRVAPFGAAPEFDTDRILYTTEKFTVDSYYYHAWMAKPAALVQYFLGRDLQQNGLLRAVLSDSNRHRPAYLLSGSVERFLEIDQGSNWSAELSLSILLQRLPQGGDMAKVLSQRRYQAKKACSRQNPQAVAEAMSQAMAELSGQIQQDIYALIKDDLAERAGG